MFRITMNCSNILVNKGHCDVLCPGEGHSNVTVYTCMTKISPNPSPQISFYSLMKITLQTSSYRVKSDPKQVLLKKCPLQVFVNNALWVGMMLKL